MRLPLALATVVLAPLVWLAGAQAQRGLHGGSFYANCGFSHTGNDDPIVHPGHPGRSHAHTFFGNRSTDAASTVRSLRAADTTCKPRADTAAYWVPTLFKHGREVRPAKGQFYYVMRGYEEMRPFPAGLKMIAGNADARTPQPMRVTHWACGGGGGVRVARSSVVPARCKLVRPRFTEVGARIRHRASVQTFVELHVVFPDCWDGKRLDSADHRSHMAYSRRFVCPASHPVKVPSIRAMIRYPITDGAGVELASGGQLSGHADFFNAWDQRALERLVDDCFHDRPCNEPAAKRSR